MEAYLGSKYLFVFYADKFEIYKDDKMVLSVPYSNVVQEKTTPLGTRALNIYCKGVGRFPRGELIISIIRQKTAERDKIYNTIKNSGQ